MVVAEVVCGLAGVVVAVLCWRAGVSTAVYAPVAEDVPEFTGVHYSGPWITAAFLSALVAGLLAVDARRRHRASGYP